MIISDKFWSFLSGIDSTGLFSVLGESKGKDFACCGAVSPKRTANNWR